MWSDCSVQRNGDVDHYSGQARTVSMFILLLIVLLKFLSTNFIICHFWVCSYQPIFFSGLWVTFSCVICMSSDFYWMLDLSFTLLSVRYCFVPVNSVWLCSGRKLFADLLDLFQPCFEGFLRTCLRLPCRLSLAPLLRFDQSGVSIKLPTYSARSFHSGW